MHQVSGLKKFGKPAKLVQTRVTAIAKKLLAEKALAHGMSEAQYLRILISRDVGLGDDGNIRPPGHDRHGPP